MKKINVYAKLYSSEDSLIKSNIVNLDLKYKNIYLNFEIFYPILASFNDNPYIIIKNNETFFFEDLYNIKIKVLECLYLPNLEKNLEICDINISKKNIFNSEIKPINLNYFLSYNIPLSSIINLLVLKNYAKNTIIKNIYIEKNINTNAVFCYDDLIIYQPNLSDTFINEINLNINLNKIILQNYQTYSFISDNPNENNILSLSLINQNSTDKPITIHFTLSLLF